jgi:hypothetical protein
MIFGSLRPGRVALLGLVVGVLQGLAAASQAQVACELPDIAKQLPEGCKRDFVSASGNQRPTTFWAMRSARNHWRDQVVTRFGERFAQWSEAACQRQECVPASLSGFTRCTLSGYPCVTKPELQAPLDLSSAEVQEMQRLLNRLVKTANLAIDGEFGPKTARALEDWQRTNGQTIDGAPTRENLEKLRQAA